MHDLLRIEDLPEYDGLKVRLRPMVDRPTEKADLSNYKREVHPYLPTFDDDEMLHLYHRAVYRGYRTKRFNMGFKRFRHMHRDADTIVKRLFHEEKLTTKNTLRVIAQLVACEGRPARDTDCRLMLKHMSQTDRIRWLQATQVIMPRTLDATAPETSNPTAPTKTASSAANTTAITTITTSGKL